MMAVKPLQSDRDVVLTQVNPESRKVEELRQLIVLWRLYVLLSQRVVNKRHEAILLFSLQTASKPTIRMSVY